MNRDHSNPHIDSLCFAYVFVRDCSTQFRSRLGDSSPPLPPLPAVFYFAYGYVRVHTSSVCSWIVRAERYVRCVQHDKRLLHEQLHERSISMLQQPSVRR